MQEYINQYCSKTVAAIEEVEQSDPDRYWQIAQGLPYWRNYSFAAANSRFEVRTNDDLCHRHAT